MFGLDRKSLKNYLDEVRRVAFQPFWERPQWIEQVKEALKEALKRLIALSSKVRSPALAHLIQARAGEIQAQVAKGGDLTVAQSAIEELERFTSKAIEVTEKLLQNINKAKTLMWALPPQARKALEVIVVAAEKQLNGSTNLNDMEAMNQKLERALYLAGRIADAGPGALETVGAELRELTHLATDVAHQGTDRMALSKRAIAETDPVMLAKRREADG